VEVWSGRNSRQAHALSGVRAVPPLTLGIDTSFEFKPVLYRRYLDRDRGTEGRLTLGETPVSSRSQLKDSLTLLLNRLRKTNVLSK
jgi:hypothetical protein